MESSSEVLKWVLIAACVGSGMMAGLFSAFSTFMMKALSSLSDSEGMKAMQAINRLIVRPSFLLVFLGTAVLCIVAAVFGSELPRVASQTIAATVIYVVACILSTIAFNIPLNNQLEAANPDTQEGREVWKQYLSKWTKWNHLRSVASVVTTALLASALAKL